MPASLLSARSSAPKAGAGTRPTEAIREHALRKRLLLSPDDVQSKQALAELYTPLRMAHWLEQLSARAATKLERAALLSDAALCFERGGLGRLAIDLLVEALELDPKQPPALIALARLARQHELLPLAARALKQRLEQALPDSDALAELRALAQCCVARPLLHPLADELLGMLAEVDASGASALQQERKALATDVEGRIKKLREEAIAARDKNKAVDNYLLMAGLYAVYAKDKRRAREHIDKCLLLSPGHHGALALLEAIHPEGLADSLQDAAKKIKARDRKAAVALWVRVEDYEAALALEPSDPWVLRRHAKTLTGQALSEWLEAQAKQCRDPLTAAWLERRLLMCNAERPLPAGVIDRALEHLRELDPEDPEAAEISLGRLRQSKNTELLLRTLAAQEQRAEGAEKAQLCEEQAEHWLKLQNTERAYEAYRNALLAWPTAERGRKLMQISNEANLALTQEALNEATATAASDYKGDLARLVAEVSQPAQTKAGPASEQDVVAQVRVLHTRGELGPALADKCQELLALDPLSQEAHEALAACFRKDERWPELADVLHRLINLLGNTTHAVELGKLYEQRLGRPADAATLYIQLLDQVPELAAALERLLIGRVRPAEVAEALARHYSARDIARAKELYATAFQHSREPRLLWALARITPPDEALGHICQALQLDPTMDEQLVADLLAAASPATAQSTLQRLLTLPLAPAARARFAMALGDAHAASREHEQAAEAWLIALEAGADVADKLDKKVTEYGLKKQLDAYLAIAIERAPGDAQAELLWRRFELTRDRSLLDRYMLLRPSDERAQQALRALLENGQDTTALIRLLEDQLHTQPSGDILLRLATLRPEQRTDYLLRALDTDKAAEAEAQLDGKDPRAAAALLDIYKGRNDRSGQLRCLDTLTQAGSGADRARYERARMALFEEAGDLANAFAAGKCAFVSEAGQDRALEDALFGLGEKLGKIPEVIDALRQSQPHATRERAAQMSHRIASTIEMDTQTTDESSIEAWRQAVAADPSNLEALGSLERALREAGRLRDLVEVLRMRQNAEPSRRVELGLELANTFAGPLQDTPQAIAEYYACAELSPTDPRPYRGLTDLYLANRQFTEGKEALLKELERTPDTPERRTRLVLLARVYFEGLQDTEGAMSCAADVIKGDPSNAEATTLLEQVMQIVSAETQAKLAQVLEPAYLSQNNFPKMAHAREIRISATQDPLERKELLVDAAKLYEQRANDLASSFALLGQAFRIDAKDERVRSELERLATKMENMSLLATEYEAALPAINDNGYAINLHRKLAELYEKQLKQPEQAVKHLKAAADLAGGDVQSLEQMARLLRGQDKPAELAEVLAKQVSLMTEAQKDQKVKLLVELGELRLTKVEDKEGAINAFQQVVTLDPKHQKALEALDRMLTELDRKQDLISVLLLRKEVAGASDLGVDINVRLGDLHKDRPSDALQFYKTALQRRPQNAPALAAMEALLDQPDVQMDVAAILEPLYTAKQDYARLARVLEVRLGRAQQLAEKKGLMRRIGDIYENRLSEKGKAFTMALKAMREDPADMGIRMWLEKLAQETGSFAELADAYVEQAGKAEQALALQFHRRAATLYYEKVSDAPKAIEQFRDVLARDAKDVPAHTALEKLYGQTGQKQEQSDVLLKLVDLTPGTEKKLELLSLAGALQEELGELEQALNIRKRVMQLAPEDIANFDAMGSIYDKLGHPEEWAKAIEVEIARIADKRGPEARARRLDLTFRKGLVTETQLSDPSEAAKIFDSILQEEPNHAAVITHLEDRVRAGQAAFAAVALERVYQQNGDWRKFVDVLEAQLGQTAEHDTRKALLIKIASTYQNKLHVQDMAFLALSRAFGEDSSDIEVRTELERLADANSNHAELVELYASEVEVIADPILKLQLTNKVAELYHKKLGDKDKAIEWYRKVLSHDGANPAALQALAQIYEEVEQWAALTEVLETSASVADKDPEKVELLLRLGVVWGDKMFEPDAAIRALEQARGLAPQDLRVLAALERYFGDAKAYDELAKVLRDMDAHPQQTREEKIRVRSVLAQTLNDHLRDPNGAVDAWKAALELDAANKDAIEALDALYRQLERYQELADLLQGAITATKVDADRLDYNRRLAEVMADHLGNTDVAVQQWQAVLRAEPRRIDALRALIMLHGKRGEWVEQAEMAKRLIPLITPAEAKAIRFVRMDALTHIETARDEAVSIGREILSAAPHTPEELAKLADLFEAVMSWEDAAKAVDRSVELQPNTELRLKALKRSADIYLDHLNRPTAAVPSYEKILEINPTDKGAFDQVRKILRTAREWRRLVATDEGFVSQYQGEGRLELLEEIRDIHDRELGQKDLAFIAACRVFRESPIESASVAAERLAGETEGWEELCAVYEDALEEIDDLKTKVEVQRRLARMYTDRMNELGAAEEVYERILDLSPGDTDALDRLVEIRSKQGRLEDQVNALEAKLSHAPDVDAKKSILRQIASVWDALAQDVERAIATQQRILDLDPGDRIAIDALSAIYERENRFEQLIDILSRAIDLATDKKTTIPLREKIGSLYEGKLDNQEKAIETYRSILEIDQAQLSTLQALERLYTGMERWRELLEVFEKEIAAVDASDEKIKLFTKAAAVFEEHFDDKKNALVCYDNVLALDPNNFSALKNEERLLKETKEWEKLIQVLQHHATLLSDSMEIVKIYIQIGDIFYKNLARVDKAEEYFNAARALDPEAGDALNALGKLYERSGNWFQSLEMLQKEAEAAKDEGRQVDLYFRMGKINENMLMDTGAAKGCYQRALEINSKYVPALAALKDIAQSDKDWDNYIEYMVQEADATEDPELKTELFYEAGKFYAEKRDDQETAMRFYAKALDNTPDYLEAAKPLAEIYYRKEMWEDAERTLEVVVAKLDPKADVKELGQKWYRLAYLADKMRKAENAIERYERAFEIDPTYLPTLEGLGQAYIRVEKWEQALKAFNAILVHHKENLTNAELVDLFAQTGDLLMRTGQNDKAKKQFEKAIELEPHHPAALHCLSRVLELTGDYEGAYDALNRYVDVSAQGERANVLLQLATLSREHLKDPYRAIDALLEAQKVEPQNVDVLEALVQLYQDTKQLQKIADLSEQLVELVSDDRKKIALAMRLGEIYSKEIKDPNRALKYFNIALDVDPAQAAAFEAIEKMLSDLGEWKVLEENYRAMIARLPATARKAKAALFRTLAELYKQVLKEPDNATTAYEVVVKLDAGNEQDALTLAALYGEKPELRPKAIAMQQEILRTAKNPVLALRELRKLYQADKKFDRVYCVAQALVFMKQANDEEKKIFDYLKKGVPAKASKPLTEALIRDHLVHPQVKGGLGELTANLYKASPDSFTRPAKDLDLKKKDQVDLKASQLFFVNILKYCMGALNAPQVEVYRRSGSLQELELVNARPPAIAAGEENAVFKETSHKLLAFHIARNLMFARPELFLARIYPGDQLRDLVAGFITMFNPKAGQLGNPNEVQAWLEVLTKIPEQALRRLKDLAIPGYNDMKAGMLKPFAEACEHTAFRAGLLLSGDIEVAARAASDAADGAARIAPADRVRELVMFSVSEDYFVLREALGLAIKG